MRSILDPGQIIHGLGMPQYCKRNPYTLIFGYDDTNVVTASSINLYLIEGK